jgi:hypothetical protein
VASAAAATRPEQDRGDQRCRRNGGLCAVPDTDRAEFLAGIDLILSGIAALQ